MKRQGGDEMFRRFMNLAQGIWSKKQRDSVAREKESQEILARMGLSNPTLKTLLVLADLKGVDSWELPIMIWRVAKAHRVHPQLAGIYMLQGEGWTTSPLGQVSPKTKY